MAEEKTETKWKEIGKVVNYLDKISVAIIDLTGTLKKGATIKLEGISGDTKVSVEQTADSMQIDRKDIESAKAGDSIGLKVSEEVRENFKVFKKA